MHKFQRIVDFIRSVYSTDDFIPLHAPVFRGNEKKYLEDCIDSTFVSSVGKYVDMFEKKVAEFTSAGRAVAVVNGTSALHVALKLVGVESGSEVITQPLTFIATCNAIAYCGAHSVFVDVDIDTMGLSPSALRDFLKRNCDSKNGNVINKVTGRRVTACVPMHTFGHPVRIEEISDICREWDIPLVEDAAESLGSYVGGRHTGLFGRCGILSFNGNKTITTGGGGVIIADDTELGKLAKHLTTTAKIPHPWEFCHDMTGYNYRMPNINAALGCAQLEQLPKIISKKRIIAGEYRDFFLHEGIEFVEERSGVKSNYWLNALKFDDISERDEFLEFTNTNGVMTRPIWNLMNHLEMYRDCFAGDLANAETLQAQIVNIPSSVR